MKSMFKYAAAAVIVLACSVEAKAQPWGYGYGRPGTYNYNCTGCFPGAGPYDSSIAVAGISAGAAVLGTAIGAIAASRQPAPVMIQQGYPMVVQQPVVVQGTPVVVQGFAGGIPGAPVCTIWVTGVDPAGRPVTVRQCR